ncbi:MAG: hypothetical protein Salg2KO_04350 [Salibacteraceae bacterium]
MRVSQNDHKTSKTPIHKKGRGSHILRNIKDAGIVPWQFTPPEAKTHSLMRYYSFRDPISIIVNIKALKRGVWPFFLLLIKVVEVSR